MNQKIFALLISLFTLSGCNHKTVVKKKVEIKKTNASKPRPTKAQTHGKNVKAIPVTIWVHGTKMIGNLSDHIHATDKPGLNHISSIPSSYRLKNIITQLSKADSETYPYEHCYVYGWEGVLCFEHRQKKARDFYNALKLLAQDYEIKYGAKPVFTIVTHSHGGNFLLNLIRAKDAHCPFTIKRVILLACPVQHETKLLVNDPLFEKVYSFYSSLDMIQVLDPQGLYKTEHNETRHLEFSERIFPWAPNLTQAELKINNHGIMHIGFVTQSFAQLLPEIINTIDQWELEEPSTENQKRILSIYT